ncbi:hypothetical protein B9479_002630 [Cryptococcus floricola]|uniref:O-methyltransferase n=1 Tax=Cryptococcus floricola TaxID=2591691 RepID=A0A5D3B2C1_9TREE|nr:hypothetical protein B9479_002630 [Cryptococcus floricola]
MSASEEYTAPGESIFPTHAEVDHYLLPKLATALSPAADPSLPLMEAHALASGLPSIAVSPLQGQFLTVLLLSIGAKRVLEVGTLAGVSTFFLAKGMPEDGQLDTLEVSEKHAQVAQDNFERIGIVPKPRVHVGPASETLRKMEAPVEGLYDFVFIDADKAGTLEYVQQGLRMLRKGGLIVVDNAIRGGRVALTEAQDPDPEVTGMRALFDWIEEDDGRTVLANVTQTVGAKFYDGFAILTKLVN